MRWCRQGLTLCVLFFALNLFAATPPLITTQPTSKTVLLGSNVVFSVAASTGTTLSYQWYLNGIVIQGATNSSFTIAKVQFTNAGPYYVNVVNAGGTVKSAIATLNVNPPSGSTLAAPWASADIGTVGLMGDYWEVRKGIKARILFRWKGDLVEFVLAGNHDDIKRFLKNS